MSDISLKKHIETLESLIADESWKRAEKISKKGLKEFARHAVLTHYHALILVNLGKPKLALNVLDRGCATFPENVDLYMDRVEVLHAMGNLEGAASSLRHVINTFSRVFDASVYQFLAEILIELKHYAEAEKYLRIALEQDSQNAEIMTTLGDTLLWQDNTSEGIKFLKAVAYGPASSADTIVQFAHTAQKAGELKAAESAYRDAIRMRPDHSNAHRNLARMITYTKQEPHLIALEDAYNAASLTSMDRMHLSFALAKAFEDLGQFETAWRFLSEANEIQKNNVTFDIDKEQRLSQEILQTFSLKFMQDHVGTGDPNAFPIFIVGMPRSGTSLVEQIIASHPSVHGAGETVLLDQTIAIDGDFEKFLSSLSKDFKEAAFRQIGAEYWHKLKAVGHGQQYITDKLPANFRWLGLIKLTMPNAKIIHCRRDPLNTCISIYKNYFGNKNLSYAYDQEMIAAYFTEYVQIMKHWEKVAPGFVTAVQYEDLVANPEVEIRKMIETLGLEWADDCLSPHRQKRTVRTASNIQVRRPIYADSANLAHSYASFATPLREFSRNLSLK